jgi:hypothetical protein
MTRAAQLLLLLVASVLLAAAPRGGLPRVVPATPLAILEEVRERAGAEHAVLDLSTLQVARAPSVARLPAPLPELARGSRLSPPPSADAPDLREALRRVQTRRRLPRLTPAEPPWC